MSLKKYLLITLIGSLCLAILPDYILADYNNLNEILTFIGLITFGFSSIFTAILLYKEIRASRILRQAEATDPDWDQNNLKICARGTFYKVQSAFDNGDTTNLKDVTTEEFFATLQGDIKNAANDRKKFSIGCVDIEETNIICCKDYFNNDNDKFVAYIKGALTEHNKDHDTSPISERFSEMYHFVRHQDNWLLNKIDGNPKILDLLRISSFVES